MDKPPFALIVEDDLELSDIFAIVLQVAGFETEIVRDGLLVVGRIAETLPDIVILDMHLPNLSGMDILTQIRADDRLAATRVAVITADPMLAKASEEQADVTLIKPVSFDQISAVAEQLAQPRPAAS